MPFESKRTGGAGGKVIIATAWNALALIFQSLVNRGLVEDLRGLILSSQRQCLADK